MDSESSKSIIKITEKTPADRNRKNAAIIVPFKHLRNFWRTLEMPLVNCEVDVILTSSKDSVTTNSPGAGNFKITETKLYVPIVTWSTHDNTKLLQQLKSGFKITISWNKYELNVRAFSKYRYLNHLTYPSF